jgi:hypothetical protein
MILRNACRFGRIRRLHAVCVLLCCCAIPFAVGCKSGNQSGGTGNASGTGKAIGEGVGPATEQQIADAIFKDNKPFDPMSYKGAMNVVGTVGNNTGTIALYQKVGSGFKPFGEIEIKGKILIGAEGVLGYTDTFQRIKFTDGDGKWKEIGRRAIKDGHMFIETMGDAKLFTISHISAGQYNAVIEPGIHPES